LSCPAARAVTPGSVARAASTASLLKLRRVGIGSSVVGHRFSAAIAAARIGHDAH